MIDKTAVQYSLYLVTDSSEAILGNKNLLTVVENAIRGGVKVVQLREKHLGVEKFIELGREMHKLTRSYGIPLLINDRVDVAQAVGCEGVHLGQDDTGSTCDI